jgi:hypothetical protein
VSAVHKTNVLYANCMIQAVKEIAIAHTVPKAMDDFIVNNEM